MQVGTIGEADLIDDDSVVLPAAWEARFPTSADALQTIVSESDDASGVRLMRRVLVDGVVVQESVSKISATCNLSPNVLLGRSY